MDNIEHALLALAERIDQAGGGPLYIDHTAASAIREIVRARQAPAPVEVPRLVEELKRLFDDMWASPKGSLTDWKHEQLIDRLASAASTPVGEPAGYPTPREIIGDVMNFRWTKDGMVRGGNYIALDHLCKVFEARLAATPASPPPSGAETQASRDVLAERQRQVSAEGWTPDHDDEHREGEMCFAAAGYACAASDALQAIEHQFDGDGQPTFNEPASLPHRAPWPHGWVFKKAPIRRQLVKAGALILAEIERIDRLLARGPICSDCGAKAGAAHNYGCMYSNLDV